MSRCENISVCFENVYNFLHFLHFLQIIAGLSYRYLEMKRIVLILSNKYRFICKEVPSIFIYERRFPSIFQNFVQYFNYSVSFFTFFTNNDLFVLPRLALKASCHKLPKFFREMFTDQMRK